jgi:hypothetical protein
MTAEIAVAAISGLASIFAVIITTKSGNKEITHKIETNQAVTDTKLQILTDEVRTHNGFCTAYAGCRGTNQGYQSPARRSGKE